MYTVTISRMIECYLKYWACALLDNDVPFLDDTSTVYGTFLLETLQTALSGSDLYRWFVSGFGNIERLTSPHLSAFDVPIIASIVSLVVQFFFAYRIWVLSNKSCWHLCLVICLVSRSYNTRTNTFVPNTFLLSALYPGRDCRIWWRCLCKSRLSPSCLQCGSHLQAHVLGRFASGRKLKITALVGLPFQNYCLGLLLISTTSRLG